MLAAEGWSLVLVDRCADDPDLPYPLATRAQLDEVVADCGGAEGRAVAAVADVRDQSALDTAVATAVERIGGLDAAVAAAGCLVGGAPTWCTRAAAWATQIGVKLVGVQRLSRAPVAETIEPGRVAGGERG